MKPRPLHFQASRRGVALIIVFAAVIILSLAIAGLIKLTQQSADETRLDAQRFDARLLAESGIALGMHPNMQSTDPALHKELPNGYKLDVTITSEQGRIFINNAGQPAMVLALRALFISWGLNADDATIASDSLADWVDTDTEARPRGAERDYYTGQGYPNFPREELMTSLEEMLLVRGMDAVAKIKPDWRDYFTLYGDGDIDINAADPVVIAALADIPLADAQRYAQTRNGADGVLGSTDDQIYTSANVNDAVALLGISQERVQEIGSSFTLQGTAKRIESKATVGDLEYRLVVITDRASGSQLARLAP